MRDALLDSFFEPMVRNAGLDPSSSAYNAARFYGAAAIASSAARFDIADGLWFDFAMSAFISIVLTRMLMLAARIGPSLLDTPMGFAHFGFRILFLILFASGVSSVLLGLVSGLVQPTVGLIWQSVGIAGLGCACASLYLGACRSGPSNPGRPRGGYA